MKTIVKNFVLLIVSILLLSSCNNAGKDKDVIKIGVIAPLTGEAESFGKSMKNGIQLLIDSIYLKGGINGKKIELVIEDDKLSPKEGVNAFNKLVNIDKVQAIIGSAASSISLALLPMANENKIVMISSISTADDLKGTAKDYFFRVVPPNYKQGKTAVKFIIDDLKKDKIAMLYANDDYGISFSKSFENSLKEKNIEVLYKNSYNAGTKDYKNLLLQIKRSNPHVVFLAGIIPETALILRQAKEIGLSCIFISGDGSYSPELINIAGKAANESYYTLMTLPDDTITVFSKFKKQYISKFGYEPDLWAAYSYDATLALITAIEAAKTYEGEAIKNALFDINITGVTGKIKFDEFGEIQRDYSIFVVKEGKFRLLKN